MGSKIEGQREAAQHVLAWESVGSIFGSSKARAHGTAKPGAVCANCKVNAYSAMDVFRECMHAYPHKMRLCLKQCTEL